MRQQGIYWQRMQWKNIKLLHMKHSREEHFLLKNPLNGGNPLAEKPNKRTLNEIGMSDISPPSLQQIPLSLLFYR